MSGSSLNTTPGDEPEPPTPHPAQAGGARVALSAELPPGFRVPDDPADPVWRVQRDLATGLHQLGRLLVTSAASIDALGQVEQLVQRARAVLEAAPSRTFLAAHYARSGGDEHEYWADRGPVIGRSNPASPPIELRVDGDQVRGSVCFDDLFQGAPGCVHGGQIAAGFDHVLGAAALRRGVVCMTGKLSVKYRRPTRLSVPLEFCARIKSVVGRATVVTGELTDAQGITAEAEGMFVELSPSQMQALLDAHPSAEQP